VQHDSILNLFSLFALKRTFSAPEIDQQVFQYLGKENTDSRLKMSPKMVLINPILKFWKFTMVGEVY
jgi:hypothetical protein